EAARVVASLLSDLIDRGLDAQRMRLWVIDGGKALRKAIVQTFGACALIQRCQEHYADLSVMPTWCSRPSVQAVNARLSSA
ncbi:MAG: transposase, partial [Burkholderiaceae bacterium]|nr:transposase [Burkholderiaceae bacterium]